MVLNLFGLTQTLRNPQIVLIGAHPHDLRLSLAQVEAQIRRRPGEPDRDYIYRLTDIINGGMVHYWGDEVRKYNLRVPAWENYLLYAGSYIRPDIYLKYEFAQPEIALERGVGLCSQHAIVLATLLQQNGVRATLMGLSGHVVVSATDSTGRPYLADADFGPVLPFDIATAEKRPELVRNYYRPFVNDEKIRETLVQIYGPDGNRPWTVQEYFYQKIYYVEYIAYILKWLIPIALFLPLVSRIWNSRAENCR